jgi:UDP-glucuronate 4-epimerase
LTGAAGFIGFHLAQALIERGFEVLAIDNLNDYYNPKLKHDRLAALGAISGFRFVQLDITNADQLVSVAQSFRPTVIVHLAAQAGVRYSLENPAAYVDSNVLGHLNMLELARRLEGLQQLVYASSSSVYGNRSQVPFVEADRCDDPASVYAATKKAGEVISQAYANLYGLSLTGLRFFTVYGPWGRPDMAYWLFTDAILRGKPITLFNNGDMRRDFTDVRDIVEGISRMVTAPPRKGHEVYNIGHSEPVTLRRFLTAIETALGKKAVVELAPMQPGDVGDTYADVTKLQRDYGYHPAISIEDGIERFVRWYREYQNL